MFRCPGEGGSERVSCGSGSEGTADGRVEVLPRWDSDGTQPLPQSGLGNNTFRWIKINPATGKQCPGVWGLGLPTS